jgi:hypothetical protein
VHIILPRVPLLKTSRRRQLLKTTRSGHRSPYRIAPRNVGPPHCRLSQILAVIGLLSRSWSHRTWTFREIVAGGASSDIRCGPFAMQFSDLERVWALDICGYYDALPWPSPAAEALGQVLNISNEHAARRTNREPPRIGYLLGYTKPLKVSDARDKVHALMGILKSEYAQYTSRLYPLVSHAYCAAVKASISVDQCLAMLNIVERVKQGPGDLPSWSPDFPDGTHAFGVYLGMRPLSGKRRFSASGNSRPELVPLNDPAKLALKGFRLKQIVRTLRVYAGLVLDDPPPASIPLDSPRWVPKTWRDMYRHKARTIPQSCAGVSRHLPTKAINLPTRAQTRSGQHSKVPSRAIYTRGSGTRKTCTHNFPADAAWMYKGFRGDAPAQILREHDNYVA